MTLTRIYHTWEKWECYPAGFYEDRPPNGLTQEQCEEEYRAFLSDPERFRIALEGVTSEWKHSCEHYLTNDRMNRIAWLGRAAMAYARRMPCICRGGYNRLTPEEQRNADLLALEYLNRWLVRQGHPGDLTLDTAQSRTQPELY